MKTQTTQLSLLETKQVTGGINLEAPIEYVIKPITWIHFILPPNLEVNPMPERIFEIVK